MEEDVRALQRIPRGVVVCARLRMPIRPGRTKFGEDREDLEGILDRSHARLYNILLCLAVENPDSAVAGMLCN